jgi:predicted DNA-binding ribbon-helix-helix protein
MKSVVVKRSVVISGRKTGVSLEDEMSAKCHKRTWTLL